MPKIRVETAWEADGFHFVFYWNGLVVKSGQGYETREACAQKCRDFIRHLADGHYLDRLDR